MLGLALPGWWPQLVARGPRANAGTVEAELVSADLVPISLLLAQTSQTDRHGHRLLCIRPRFKLLPHVTVPSPTDIRLSLSRDGTKVYGLGNRLYKHPDDSSPDGLMVTAGGGDHPMGHVECDNLFLVSHDQVRPA